MGCLPFSRKNRLVESGNFHGMCVFYFHGHLHRDEYKSKGLELVKQVDGTHIFRSDIPVGNFGLPLKTFRLFRKFSGRANQNTAFPFTFQPKFPDIFGKMVNTHGNPRITERRTHSSKVNYPERLLKL